MFKKYGSLSLSLLVLASMCSLVAMNGGQGSDDPLVRVNYRRVFDHSKIDKKFKTLLQRMGCAENVFGQRESDGLGSGAQAISDVLPEHSVGIAMSDGDDVQEVSLPSSSGASMSASRASIRSQ